ncbi:hypothetical protein BX600DRAFT_505953 [Xylariales sp. PMI_506]|nr:hypothetical protein BX600DRAFT_505953 [Xylariales sp. PMI_506]
MPSDKQPHVPPRHDPACHADGTPDSALELDTLSPGTVDPSSSREHAVAPRLSHATTAARSNFSLSRFWNEHIELSVELKVCRDHLALERTFLAYLRTSSQLALLGVSVAQLFTLQSFDAGTDFPLIGKCLATACYASAIWTLLAGAYHAWRFQKALMHNRAVSGGLGLNSIAAVVLVLTIVFFGLHLAIDTTSIGV